MDTNDHHTILKRGVEAWNNWRKENPAIKPNLNSMDLSGVDLKDVNLVDADLGKANLEGVNLSRANLQDANLAKANLKNSRLSDAILKDADLSGAVLTGVEDLVREQLAGADVNGATLPEILPQYKKLSNVEEASKNARKLFFAMLLTCAYVFLTVLTTKDVDLVTNNPSSQLPIIDTKIPYVVMYYIAPILLISIYLYFHLYLQRLWDELAALPAVFPDGCSLDKKVYPWLLNCLVCSHLKRLPDDHQLLYKLRKVLLTFLAWIVVPLILIVIWWRYLDRHEWLGTLLHIGTVIFSLFLLSIFTRLPNITFEKTGENLYTAKGILIPITVGIILLILSFGSIESVDSGPPFNTDTNRYTQSALKALEFSPQILMVTFKSRVADLENEEVSTISKNSSVDIELVKGANLRGKNLKRVQASGSLLAKANLYEAVLDDAKLNQADLRSANLGDAHLIGANLELAKLSDANLDGADLRKSKLIKTNLQNASLTNADLRRAFLNRANLQGAFLNLAKLNDATFNNAVLKKADLTGADLTEADLTKADITGSDIKRAVFNGVVGVTISQIKSAKNWELAYYSDDLLKLLDLPEDHNEKVKKLQAETKQNAKE